MALPTLLPCARAFAYMRQEATCMLIRNVSSFNHPDRNRIFCAQDHAITHAWARQVSYHTPILSLELG